MVIVLAQQNTNDPRAAWAVESGEGSFARKRHVQMSPDCIISESRAVRNPAESPTILVYLVGSWVLRINQVCDGRVCLGAVGKSSTRASMRFEDRASGLRALG